MFERLRFLRYALAFERAFKTDDWEPVKKWFHPDAVYTIAEGTKYSGDHRGPDAIIDVFRLMLNEIDRKYDKRSPKPRGWWRLRDGVLHVPWAAEYRLGAETAILTGESWCRFRDGKILELRDTADPAQWDRWTALAARSTRPR